MPKSSSFCIFCRTHALQSSCEMHAQFLRHQNRSSEPLAALGTCRHLGHIQCNPTLQLLKGLAGRGLYFYALLLQVSNPQGMLDDSQAGALHTAAALFSLEAGGPQSGASLEGAPSPGFHRPSGPPPHSSFGRGIQNGR